MSWNIIIILIVLGLVGIPFGLYALYFFVVGLMGFQKHNTYAPAKRKYRFAAVVAARNEGMVIGNLIDTLKAQNYPKGMLDVYVIPNNCTDDTAQQALAHGAKIFTPTREVRSKGAALEQFFDHALKHNDHYDAYCVFDADNLVDPNFVDRMNDAFAAGATVAQGYRESKNPKDSWISASQTVFYMIVNRFLNLARFGAGMSAALNGTGFMVSRKALLETGWHTHTLTEDIEYTVQTVCRGQRVFWVPDAITYDEHPLTFDASWKQRKRWSTGVLQCFSRYPKELYAAYKETRNFACIDMILYLAAPTIQLLSLVYFVITIPIVMYVVAKVFLLPYWSSFSLIMLLVALLFCAGTVYLIVRLEKHKKEDIKGSAFVGFWWYLISWIFINVDCLIRPLTSWEPIAHTQSLSMSQIALRQQ